jgi:hypothetical protein
MKKHYETYVEDTDKLISVAGPVLDYKSRYEQYRKLMEEQAQRKYGLYTPTSEGDDDFPSISGMIARYSALGLTNEQMAENPVWKDLTGNGHDLQMKNFAWKGMSGVGGYTENYDSDKWYKVASRIDTTWTYKSFNVKSIKDNNLAQLFYQSLSSDTGFRVLSCTIKVSGLTDGQGIEYVSNGTQPTVIMRIENDGIYHLPSFDFGAKNAYYGFKFSKLQESCNITIEQLPLYPGAIVFDGVNDYGICENFPVLTKEKGYTVVALRQWISMGEEISGLVSNVKNWFNDGAFVLEYNSNNATNKFVNRPVSFGKVNIEMDLPNNFTYQTSKSYKGVPITTGSFKGTNSLFVGKLDNIIGNCSNVAIWELVFLDHDATEEELTKIKDYFVKTYPWLFPDQAWTVTGKTNEDEDRATITNITGNGNDLVLSNFGFAEGSGYGLYAYNFNSFNLRDNVVKPTDVKKDSFRIIGTGNSGNVLVLSNTSNSAAWKIRITGMKEGDSCIVGNANKSGDYIKIIKDGIYTFQKQYAATSINGIWYNSSQEVDVLVEQIPEYEGYLITDGVDDEIISAKLIQFADKFTIVGDWKFMEDRKDNAGLLKANQIYIYNATTGMRIYLKQGSKNYPFSCKKINALTSDGWVYDEKWDKYKVYPIGSDIDISSRLFLGFYGSNFTQIALKNLGIYNDQLLSKDDCIKAYNYLQTLKAK